EGVGGGLVAGDEEGHDFIAELNVVHACAVFVLGGEKSLQKIVGGWLGRGAAIANNGRDDGVETATGAKQARRFGDREAVRENEGKRGLNEETFHHGGDFFADGGSVVGALRAEEGFGDDIESEAAH